LERIKRIVVIGASAGGFDVLSNLFKSFSADIPAAFFVVVHLAADASGNGLVNIISKSTSLKVKIANNDEKVKPGVIFIAPPDHHMMLEDDVIRVQKGPFENKYRPSVDQLFRSAAVTYRSRTIGIVFSGMLEDGTSGMIAIKKTGGTVVIQDPEEAAFSDMPMSVRGSVEVDYERKVMDMGKLINRLVDEEPKPDPPVPAELVKEAEIARRVLIGVEHAKEVGKLTPFVCPDCGGPLFENSELNSFRCYTGHRFSSESLLHSKTKEIEDSLWVAVRVLEEKRNLLILMSEKTKEQDEKRAAEFIKRAEESKKHIERLRGLILTLGE
jgi:two-component system, chemotaxis family, protein-glutamate methylesterase/glutaminase